jgi:hypothetical protein
MFGTLNLLLCRRHASQFFEWSQTGSNKLMQFWAALGKFGIQLLFVAIGVTLVLAGVVLWMRAF